MHETASPLHMAQLVLDGREVMRSGRRQGLGPNVDDLGYLLHGLLRALFGELAPKPFHARTRQGDVEVLGYTEADDAALRDHMASFAEPFDAKAVRSLAAKAMPSRWEKGRRLGFEVRTSPVVRVGRGSSEKKPGAEVDVFLAACDRQQEGDEERLDRHEIYHTWLAAQLEPAATLVRAELVQVRRRVRLFRRTQGEKRVMKPVERPEATFQGELEVADPEAFARLLARGVGRHRAFGFGMLLLRPPGGRG